MKWIFTKTATIVASICSVILIIFTAWILLHTLALNNQKEIGKSLTTVLNTTHQAVKIWSEQKRNLTRTLAEDAELVSLSKRLLQHPPSQRLQQITTLQKKIQNKLQPVLASVDFQGYIIADPDFNVLDSNNNEKINLASLIGKQPHFHRELIQGKTALSLPTFPGQEIKNTDISYPAEAMMFVAAPIKDKGKIITFLIFRIDPNINFSELFLRGRIGETGETYAFNQDAILITRSRFVEHLIKIGLLENGESATLNIGIRDPGVNLVEGEHTELMRNQQPLTLMADQATRGQAGLQTEGYRDYRGVPVIGAWLWDNELQLGITTEIDVAEAYQGYYSTRNFILIAALFATALFAALSYIFTSFNKELEKGVTERTLALAKSEARIQNLQRTTSAPDLSFEEKLEKMLSLGLNELDLEIGIVSKITANEYEVFSVVTPGDAPSIGMKFDLGHTYCDLTIQNNKPTWTEHARDSQWQNHPCYIDFKLETYIGTPIKVNDEVFGTLNFSSPSPRDKKFSKNDIEFIQLMAQWIELEIEQQQSEKNLQDNNKILSAISHVQSSFITEADNRALFDGVLQKILDLSQSEYGFIGEILQSKDDTPYLKTYAITNIAWDSVTQAFYEENALQGMEFYNLESLFGNVMKTGEVVIANEPQTDPRRTGIPQGHPALDAFLGIPIYSGSNLVGMVGVANRPGGYDMSLVEYLHPYITTCANLITAFNTRSEAKATEETVRLLMESASEGIYGLDLNGCTTFANPAACRMVGYRLDELLGQPMHALIHHSYPDGTLYPREQCHMYESFMKGITTRSDNEVLWRKDGSSFPVEYTSTPIRKGNDIVGAVVVFTDITQKRNAELELREEKEKTAHILETSKDAYLAINRDWVITYANKRVNALIAADPEAITGKTISSSLPWIYEIYKDVFTEVMRSHKTLNKTNYCSTTGKWLETQINPSKQGLTVNFRDVTKNKLDVDELKNKEMTIRTIFDTVADGIITTNKSGIVESFNAAAENIFGYTADEVMGENVKMLMPQPYYSEHDQYLQNYLQTGKAKIIGKGREVVGRRKDGSTFPLELSVSEMMLGELKFTGVVRDVTKRNQAERMLHETMATKQAILDSANFSIISTDVTGLIKTFNVGAQRMLGYHENEMVDKQTPALIHDKDEVIAYAQSLSKELGYEVAPNFDVFVAKVKLGGADEQEWTYIRKDGSRVPVLLSVTAIRDGNGKLSGFLGIAVDITEQKINDKMKDEFISTVSHELRTPLTSIRGSLGLVTGGATGELPGSIRSLINIAYKNTDRLLLLINDILDINKIESGNMPFRFKSLHASSFLKNAIVVNQGYADQQSVYFSLKEIADDIYIYADEDRLMQVMSNLLSNAAKFSPPNSAIEISVSRMGNSVRISVADHGPGIPEEFQDKVFEKFTQQDSSDTRKVGGTGLGLSITKAIIIKHNGRIDFASKKDVGTVFYFDLPVLEDISLDMSNINQLDSVIPSVHPVLITEDDPHIASLLKLMLTQAGFDADIALNAQAAKDLVHTRQYDAMTLDLMLPDQDGIDLFNELRNDEVTCDLPIIIISAIANETRHKLNGRNLDVVDWLEKPIDQEKLINTLHRILSNDNMVRPRILHIDNDPVMNQLIDTLFSDISDIQHVTTLNAALARLDKSPFDVALLELDLPDGSGLEVLKHERVLTDKTQVIIFTDHAPTSDSADKLRAVLLKSQTTPEELLSTLRMSLSINQ